MIGRGQSSLRGVRELSHRNSSMNKHGIQFRRLSLSEINVLDSVALNPEELAFAGGSANEIKRRIGGDPAAQQYYLFLICCKDAAVGFVSLRKGNAKPAWATDDAVTLHNLRIGSQWRGLGFGRTAIQICCRWVADQRPIVRGLELCVNEANARAIRFYEECGFSQTGATHVGRLGRQIIMRRSIERASCSLD